jgi:putative sigma-54 modulation protein
MRLEMHGLKFELDDPLKDHIERRLRSALGRLAGRIDRVSVTLTDVNGPRGGVDKRCRVAVSLVPRGGVIITCSGSDPFALAARAASRVGRATRRALERRRRAYA